MKIENKFYIARKNNTSSQEAFFGYSWASGTWAYSGDKSICSTPEIPINGYSRVKIETLFAKSTKANVFWLDKNLSIVGKNSYSEDPEIKPWLIGDISSFNVSTKSIANAIIDVWFSDIKTDKFSQNNWFVKLGVFGINGTSLETTDKIWWGIYLTDGTGTTEGTNLFTFSNQGDTVSKTGITTLSYTKQGVATCNIAIDISKLNFSTLPSSTYSGYYLLLNQGVVKSGFLIDKHTTVAPKIDIEIPNNATYFAIEYHFASEISSTYTKLECLLLKQIYPHYKSIKKQFKKESNQMFFRESIDGKINLFGTDYSYVKNSFIEDELIFLIYKNGSLFIANVFNKTDCKFDHFKKSVELKLTPRDKYTNILDKYDKTYDLMKLAVGKTALKLTKRSIIQIYIQGENTITNYSGGTYWEDEVIEPVNDQNALLHKYYFAKGPIFKEVSLSGFNYDINTAFACTNNDCWNGTSVIEYGGRRYKMPCSIKFTKIYDAETTLPTSTRQNILLLSDGESDGCYYAGGPGGSIAITKYDTYRIDIFTGDNGTGQRIYQSTKYYAKDEAFTLKQGDNLYPMQKISQSIPDKEPEPASFYLGANVIEYQIWGRLLCDVTVNSEGQTLYDLPYDDFATERANFKKCIGLMFTQSNRSLVHFYQRQDVQDEPTPWGINDFGQYFKAPFLGLGVTMFPYPLARSTWANTSLWVAFEQNTSPSLEKWCQKFYKKIWHKDCMELGAIIKALLAEIDPSIKFESTAEYSDFFYGTAHYGYGNSGLRTYLTQKSNVLKGEYDQAAQKAEITFEKLMNLLRDCFRCYWFIDSEGRFRIEHVMYFMRGMSYSSPVLQYNLVDKIDKFNKKPILYCQQEVSFAKSELNSRYEFAWADDVTECMGGGFVVDIDSNYIQKDKTESINIELATSDIDMMMFAPSKFSQDGFAIIMAKDYEVQIVRNEYYDQRDTYYPVVAYTQNYYASFLSLFQHYMYDMPASSIHTSVDKNSSRYYVSNIKRCMEHKIEYQTMDNPDVYKLIGTDVGNGYVDDVSIDIDTHLAKVTLTYEPR